VEYPVEDTVSVIEASALPDIAKEMLAEALRTGAAPNGLVKPSLPESYRDVPNGEEPPAHTQNGDHRPHSESKTVE
jgi:hypothetical protein